jgi:predicted phage terminase large subunit-like protein
MRHSRGKWVLAKHLELLNRKVLSLLATGGKKKLVVSMPPRHGKSNYISQYLPAWYLGLWPDKRVMLASYESDFAASWGRKVREVIEDCGQECFGISVDPRSSAADRFGIEGRLGGMVTAGVGSAITGRGADVLIIDDPTKNAEEAMSQTYQDRTWDWFCSTAMTRLEPGGVVIVLMTRWHKNDLAGKILKSEGDQWETLVLPAIATESDVLGRKTGDALWPERYNIDALQAIQRTIGSRWWGALYQQDPRSMEGAIFKRQWFEIIPQSPARLDSCCRFWDMAATQGDKGDPDYTAGVKIGLRDGVYYVLHVHRGRNSPAQNDAIIKQTATLDGMSCRQRMEEEGGSSGKTATSHYARFVLQGFDFRGIRATGSKALRANPFAAAAESGNVKIVAGSWNSQYLDELEMFQGLDERNDLTDASSGAFNDLARPKASLV